MRINLHLCVIVSPKDLLVRDRMKALNLIFLLLNFEQVITDAIMLVNSHYIIINGWVNLGSQL